MSALTYLARRFVAGESLDAAVRAVRVLNAQGVWTTLDVLGENVDNREMAEAASAEYLRMIEAIATHRLRSNVSLKLTQMGLDIGDEFCRENVRRILSSARDHGNFVRIDMESSAYTKRTLDIFTELYREFQNVGIVIQAALHRSEADCRMLGELKAPVRVCKGAYKERSSVAFQDMDDIRANFKILVEMLVRAGSHVAIATHDERLIRWGVEWTERESVPRDRFEFQMLYGLRRKRARNLAREGFLVRAYVPFGTHWLPYFVRRLRERKENIFFVLKSLVSD